MANITNLTIIRETDKAYQLEQNIRRGSTRHWIPKSQITYIKRHPRSHDGTQQCDITIPDWLADEKGIE